MISFLFPWSRFLLFCSSIVTFITNVNKCVFFYSIFFVSLIILSIFLFKNCLLIYYWVSGGYTTFLFIRMAYNWLICLTTKIQLRRQAHSSSLRYGGSLCQLRRQAHSSSLRCGGSLCQNCILIYCWALGGIFYLLVG